MSNKKRTLFVGLDAACWEFYQPLLDVGKLPTMQRLMEVGSKGIARSTMPAWTPTAWASIITGKNPGKHGIYDMFWLRPSTFDLVPTNAHLRQGAKVKLAKELRPGAAGKIEVEAKNRIGLRGDKRTAKPPSPVQQGPVSGSLPAKSKAEL